jgi:transposase
MILRGQNGSMAAHPLLPDPAVLTLDSLRIHEGVIVFAARAMAPSAACPCCGWRSERVHSRYRRTLLDLPWRSHGFAVIGAMPYGSR